MDSSGRTLGLHSSQLHRRPPTQASPIKSPSSLGPKFKKCPSSTNCYLSLAWPPVFLCRTADLVQALILKKTKTRPKTNQKLCSGHG